MNIGVGSQSTWGHRHTYAKGTEGVNDLPSINSTLQLVFFCTCFLHLVTVCIVVLLVTVFSVCTFCTNGDNNNNNTDYQQQSVVSNSVAVIKPQYELHHVAQKTGPLLFLQYLLFLLTDFNSICNEIYHLTVILLSHYPESTSKCSFAKTRVVLLIFL